MRNRNYFKKVYIYLIMILLINSFSFAGQGGGNITNISTWAVDGTSFYCGESGTFGVSATNAKTMSWKIYYEWADWSPGEFTGSGPDWGPWTGTVTFPKAGHYQVDGFLYEEDGVSWRSFDDGDARIDVIVDHDYSWTVTTAANCQHTGTRKGTCYCGATTTETIPKTDHNWGSWIVDTPATCTTDGWEYRECSVCGTKEWDRIYASHSFGAWQTITDSTCTGTGTKKRTCSVCGYVENGTIPVKGHDWKVISSTANCVQTGDVVSKCNRCGTEKTESRCIGSN